MDYQLNARLSSTDVACGAPANICPTSIAFSPAGLLTCLLPDRDTGLRQINQIILNECKDQCEVSELLNIDTSGKLSLQEQLRCERRRLFSHGVASFAWTRRHEPMQADMIMIPTNGQLLVCCPGVSSRCIYNGHMGVPIDPRWSPDGQQIACVINGDIYVLDIPANIHETNVELPTPIRLTFGGSLPGVSCGLADFLAQEEMDRYEGFWWSPDSCSIVYAVLDETAVPEFSIMHSGDPDPHTDEKHRYPFAGQVNPTVNLSVVSVRPLCPAKLRPTAIPQSDTPDTNFLYDQLPPLIVLPHIANNGACEDMCTPAEFSAALVRERYATREDNYIARVGWWPDGSIMVQTTNRTQTCLQLLRVQPTAPYACQVLLTEHADTAWINLHDLLRCLPKGWSPSSGLTSEPGDFYFVWGSERTGFMQLYFYKYIALTGEAVLMSADTCVERSPDLECIGGGGEWVVDSIAAVDAKYEVVYFCGSKTDVTEKHLYVSPLLGLSEMGPQCQRLTEGHGWHDVTINLDQLLCVDVFSSTRSPPCMSVFSFPANPFDLSVTCVLPVPETERVQIMTNFPMLDESSSGSVSFANPRSIRLLGQLMPPQFYRLDVPHIRGGLNCCVYRPDPAVHGEGPYACVVSCYGGPSVQRVTNTWTATADLRVQRLVQSGAVVLKVDNRGSTRRGLEFERSIRWSMGGVEIEDQQWAVKHFVDSGLIDASRVGIYGWSYGGYMSLMALCRASETFCCGVAGAPVTSWDGYDSHYTERYMGLPADNPSGYNCSSVMTHVSGLPTGRLMLMHGLIDENVHFRHTARLVAAITAARKKYDLVLFPDQRHGPRSLEGVIYLEDRIIDFFSEHLRLL